MSFNVGHESTAIVSVALSATATVRMRCLWGHPSPLQQESTESARAVAMRLFRECVATTDRALESWSKLRIGTSTRRFKKMKIKNTHT